MSTPANDTQLDSSDVSFSQLRSGDISVLNDTQNSSVSGLFKVPAPPKKVCQKRKAAPPKNKNPSQKPKLTCTYCLKVYICSRSLKKHVRAHMLEGEVSLYFFHHYLYYLLPCLILMQLSLFYFSCCLSIT